MIKFLDTIISTKKLCPICNTKDNYRYIEITPPPQDFLYKSAPKNYVLKCQSCNSLFYENNFQLGYLTDDENINKYTLNHYVLIGCGIDSGIFLLNQLKELKNSSLLEVGCGFGFNVHYWHHFLKQEAVGIELASYGQAGSKSLNIPIIKKYLDSPDDVIGKFDIVYSSEVIEHVKDPVLFLETLRANMKDEGICIITSPSADFIKIDSEPEFIISSLSYGFHEFLISKDAFQRIILKSGFTDVYIEERKEKLIAFAVISGRAEERIDKKKNSLNEYISYLDFLSNSNCELVKEGALYRLFKEQVNKGDMIIAELNLNKLLSIIKNNYQINLELLLSSPLEKNMTFEELIDSFPIYIGPLFYYMGQLFSHKPEDLNKKLLCFNLARTFIKKTIIARPQHAQEAASLYDLASNHFKIALKDNLIFEDNFVIEKNSELNDNFASYNFINLFNLILKKLKNYF